MVKRLIIFTLLFLCVAGVSFAADWSQYESGRNNIRLDGYQGQPGYIAFTDGSGNTLGYVFMSTGSGLVWKSAVGLDLRTEQLTTTGALPVAAPFSGDILNNL